MPKRDRVVVGASLGMMLLMGLAIAGLQLQTWLSHEPVGAPCTHHGDCRSQACLAVSDYQPLSFGDLGGLLTPEQTQQWDDGWNQALDPLASGRTDVRTAGVAQRYCTAPCAADGDCPDGMACGEVQSFGPSPLSGRGPDAPVWIEGEGERQRMCVRR